MPVNKEWADNELYQAVKERFQSPVWGAFLVILVLSNWPVVSLYIFSPETVSDVNNLVAEMPYPWWVSFLIKPVIILAIYLFSYDWIQGKIQLYRENRKHDAAEDLLGVKSKKALLKAKEIVLAEKAQASDEIVKIQEEVQNLKAQYEGLSHNIDTITDSIVGSEKEETKLEKQKAIMLDKITDLTGKHEILNRESEYLQEVIDETEKGNTAAIDKIRLLLDSQSGKAENSDNEISGIIAKAMRKPLHRPQPPYNYKLGRTKKPK